MLSPKEKAQELYQKMYKQLPSYAKLTAKDCTLVAIEEILECVQKEEGYIFNLTYTKTHCKYRAYWEIVKEEVIKIK